MNADPSRLPTFHDLLGRDSALEKSAQAVSAEHGLAWPCWYGMASAIGRSSIDRAVKSAAALGRSVILDRYQVALSPQTACRFSDDRFASGYGHVAATVAFPISSLSTLVASLD